MVRKSNFRVIICLQNIDINWLNKLQALSYMLQEKVEPKWLLSGT